MTGNKAYNNNEERKYKAIIKLLLKSSKRRASKNKKKNNFEKKNSSLWFNFKQKRQANEIFSTPHKLLNERKSSCESQLKLISFFFFLIFLLFSTTSFV